jgi:hypothetical protein
MAFKEHTTPVFGVGGDRPALNRNAKRTWLNPAALKLIGLAPGDRFSLYIDEEKRMLGIAAIPNGRYVLPKGPTVAALKNALDEMGAPRQGAWPIFPVDLTPVTHAAKLPKL